MADRMSEHCPLPTLLSQLSTLGPADMTKNCQLPPLLYVEPSPRGRFTLSHGSDFTSGPPSSHYAFRAKSPRSPTEQILPPPFPREPADSPWGEAYEAHEAFAGSQDLSSAELLDLIAPKHIRRKPLFQQPYDNKHQGNFAAGEPDNKREKHRIAQGKYRNNLSQLLGELDSRIHDFFLKRAGWVSARKKPESKEHIVQGAIFLIDFMRSIIDYYIQQESEIPGQLCEKLQPQVRCIQMRQQNHTAQQELHAIEQKNRVPEECNRDLEMQT